MKKKLLFLSVLALGLMTSCSQDDYASSPSINSNSIVFSTGGSSTRSGATITSLQKFTVDAVASGYGNLFTGTEFSYDSSLGVFQSSTPYYWPLSSTLSFYAISDPGRKLKPNPFLHRRTKPMYSYEDWGGETDLVAATVLSGEKTIPYPLKFQHVLSQVYISAEAAEKTEELTYELISVDMKTACNGIYSFADATDGIGTWEIDGESSKVYSYEDALPLSFEQDENVAPSDVYWNILPVTDSSIEFTVGYKVYKNGQLVDDFTGDNAKSCVVETPSLVSDKKYIYNFLLTRGADNIIVITPAESTPVDLGLPSGLKWAQGNLGADEETDPGLYYMWGDTEGHEKNSGYEFTNENYTAKGLNTISTNLSLAQDAAHVRLGGNWRMPTNEDYLELCVNCFAEWTANYEGTGKAGVIFYSTTSNTTGKGYYKGASKWVQVKATESGPEYTDATQPDDFMEYTLATPHIFMPAAGLYDDIYLNGTDEAGSYWTSTYICYFEEESINMVYYSIFNQDFNFLDSNSTWFGCSVRGVCE